MPSFVSLLKSIFCGDARTVRYFLCHDLPLEKETLHSTCLRDVFSLFSVAQANPLPERISYGECCKKVQQFKSRAQLPLFGKLLRYVSLFYEEGGLDSLLKIFPPGKIYFAVSFVESLRSLWGLLR